MEYISIEEICEPYDFSEEDLYVELNEGCYYKQPAPAAE